MELRKVGIVLSVKLLESSSCMFLISINEKQPIYLINRLSTHVWNVFLFFFPIEHVFSVFPSSHLVLTLPCHVFGYVTFVHSCSSHPWLGRLYRCQIIVNTNDYRRLYLYMIWYAYKLVWINLFLIRYPYNYKYPN